MPKKGEKHKPETLQKISISRKGKKAWNKSKTLGKIREKGNWNRKKTNSKMDKR